MSAKADRARARTYEKRERDWWADLPGAVVDLAWNECRGFIKKGGRSIPIIKRRDFFGRFDLTVVFPAADYGAGVTAWIQVTETPFVDVRPSREGYANAGAGHGDPPWAWGGSEKSVEAWALNPDVQNVQVIVSYADARHPDRRWWLQKEARKGLDP